MNFVKNIFFCCLLYLFIVPCQIACSRQLCTQNQRKSPFIYPGVIFCLRQLYLSSMHCCLETIKKVIYKYKLAFPNQIVSGQNLPIVVVGICERTGGLLRGHSLLDGLRILFVYIGKSLKYIQRTTLLLTHLTVT